MSDESTTHDSDGTASDESSSRTLVKYEVVTDSTVDPKIPDDHTQVGSDPDTYYGPESAELEAWDSHGFVKVLTWDYDPASATVFEGPPEPYVHDGNLYVARPTDDGSDVTGTKLGGYTCLRCGMDTHVADVEPDSKVELQPPTECSNCERSGPWQAKGVPDGVHVQDYVTAAWSLPSAEIEERDFADVWDDVHDYIYRYWAAGDYREDLYDGLTAFAISTWLRPNFDYLPHLLVIGEHETGKTRLLKTLRQVSYRAVVPADLTASSMYRGVDDLNISLFLSEYHGLAEEKRDAIDGVLRASQKRDEIIMRSQSTPDGGFASANFKPFTHVAIGTQFEPADDIESRTFKVHTKRANRSIPLDLHEADDLRANLLWWRFALLNSDQWDEAESVARSYLKANDITGRLAEKLLAILTVAELAGRLDDMSDFVERVSNHATDARADSDDAAFLQAVVDLSLEQVEANEASHTFSGDPWDGVAVSYSDVVEVMSDMTGKNITGTYVGHVRARHAFTKERKRDGTVITGVESPNLTFKDRLKELAEEHSIPFEPPKRSRITEELESGDEFRGDCAECGETKYLTHRHVEDGSSLCPDCAAAEDRHHREQAVANQREDHEGGAEDALRPGETPGKDAEDPPTDRDSHEVEGTNVCPTCAEALHLCECEPAPTGGGEQE